MTYLQEQIRKLLAEASIIAEASAISWDQRTSHGKPQDTIPTIGGTSTYDAVAQRFRNARTPRQQQDAVLWAQRELDTIRGRRRPKVRLERQAVLEDCGGLTAKEAARTQRTSETNVRRWREQEGLHPNTGKAA